MWNNTLWWFQDISAIEPLWEDHTGKIEIAELFFAIYDGGSSFRLLSQHGPNKPIQLRIINDRLKILPFNKRKNPQYKHFITTVKHKFEFSGHFYEG